MLLLLKHTKLVHASIRSTYTIVVSSTGHRLMSWRVVRRPVVRPSVRQHFTCEHSNAFSFDRNLIKFSGWVEDNKISDEFEIGSP